MYAEQYGEVIDGRSTRPRMPLWTPLVTAFARTNAIHVRQSKCIKIGNGYCEFRTVENSLLNEFVGFQFRPSKRSTIMAMNLAADMVACGHKQADMSAIGTPTRLAASSSASTVVTITTLHL